MKHKMTSQLLVLALAALPMTGCSLSSIASAVGGTGGTGGSTGGTATTTTSTAAVVSTNLVAAVAGNLGRTGAPAPAGADAGIETETGAVIPVHVNMNGAADGPTITFENNGEDMYAEIDGQRYQVHDARDIARTDMGPAQGDPFVVELVGTGNLAAGTPSGVTIIGTGDAFGDTTNGSDADRIDVVFVGTPTDVANLPTATASYVGTFEGFFPNEEGPDGFDEGAFSATADFGAAQSLTGEFVSSNSNQTEAILNATIEGNGFSGTVSPIDRNGDPFAQGISAGGMFMGANAEALVGAGMGGFSDNNGDEGFAFLTFEGTKQ